MSRHHRKTGEFEKALGISPPGSGETGSYQGDAEAGQRDLDWPQGTACPPGGAGQDTGQDLAKDGAEATVADGFAGDTGGAEPREE